MTLWFLVTRPLVHHTGEASSTIHTTSPSAYTDSDAETHEHKHLVCQVPAEQIDTLQNKIWTKFHHVSQVFVFETQSVG